MSHFNAALSARQAQKGMVNPSSKDISRMTSSDRAGFRSPIVQSLEESQRQGHNLAPVIKTAATYSENGNPSLDVNNLNQQSLEHINLTTDQQNAVNQSTSLPQINYQGQALNAEKELAAASQR
jgi:hypothetical protein